MAMSVLRRSLWLGVALLTACADLTAPSSSAPVKTEQAAKPAKEVTPPAVTAVAKSSPVPAASASAEKPSEVLSVAHILISYKGAAKAPKSLTRTKDEAKAFAKELVAKAKKAPDFEALVLQYSDDTSKADNKGRIPRLEKQPAFSDFYEKSAAVRPGQVADVAETWFGFHVIKRLN
jgi:hypothetical protein